MKPIEEWLDSEEVKRLMQIPLNELLAKEFSRNPYRTIVYDDSVLYSPADGTILYATVVEPDEQILNVKGRKLTVKELLVDESYDQTSIVVGIMMTVLDVHYNRMPSDGFLKYVKLPAFKPSNLTMSPVEKQLFTKLKFNADDLEYAFYNERQRCTVYCPKHNLKYHIVQIADLEVNVIANYYQSGVYLKQGEIFSFVTYGSHVDLIVPAAGNLKLLVEDKILYHVEAGIDPLVKIT